MLVFPPGSDNGPVARETSAKIEPSGLSGCSAGPNSGIAAVWIMESALPLANAQSFGVGAMRLRYSTLEFTLHYGRKTGLSQIDMASGPGVFCRYEARLDHFGKLGRCWRSRKRRFLRPR
jgi:hypothetical protein